LMNLTQLEALLNSASVDDAVFDLRPDYRAVLIAVSGINPGPSDAQSEAKLLEAQDTARELLNNSPVEQLANIAAWREAYQAFGAKPQRTRNSVEALTRRAATELPRINRLTDIYNAISVKHQIPIGGEDLMKYQGAPRLLRAIGDEPFDTITDGEFVIEFPEIGEVIWCDDEGVTCRRWNWRQGKRTALSDETTSALFILDALDPMSDAVLATVAAELVEELKNLGADVQIAQRTLRNQN
jgi:DNA/RNA-binding domain of Phe-tRNA-synthetase-like protein